MNGRLVDVAVPVKVLSSFHYEMDEHLSNEVTLGSVVQVPFRNRSMTGFVLGFPTETKVARDKLKQVESVVAATPVFDESMLKFLRWVAEYYCHPIGEVISTAVPRQNWEPSKSRRKKNDKSGDTDSLEKLSLLGSPGAKKVLTEEQARAVSAILDPADPRPVLLHGVTGSGKTEVYMQALEELIGRGKGAIVLVPEIALTPQLLDRFSGRFPGLVAVLHSDLKPGERFKQWERLKSGTARVVVGARSAVFAPMRDLGLIVVDEEHEGSFKQDESVRYHARDLAVVRATFSGAKAVLGSATPSLESYHNAQKGKYLYLRMANRVQSRPLPSTVFVDLKDPAQWYSPKVRWLTRTLAEKLAENLREGHQSMLFLNRLGYAHFLFCLDCGHTWRCLNCDVSLTYYRHPPGLKCHYCGVHKTPPEHCESCQGTNLEAMGVGTEQVEKALKEIFPSARVARMDRSVVKSRRELEAILNSINGREVDIVVGTQMIAKGHDFPGVSLVGILNADSSLNMPDFRANEKTFQTITQVSGRAGRHAIAGQVVI